MSGLAFHIVALAALFVLWVAVGLPYGSYRLRSAERGWSQSALSDQEFDRRYPRRDHSPAALRLDALARELGIFLATTDADIRERHRLTTPELDRVGEFMTSIRERADDGPVAVPPGISRVLRESASVLDQFEDTLLTDAPVDWRSNKGSEIAVSLLGFRRLQEALLVRSLLADQLADHEARDRSIAAAWRFEDSLHARPVLIDRLLAYAAARSRNACLRRFPAPSGTWLARIRPAERLPSHVDVLQADALGYCRGARRLMGFADANELFGDDLRPVGPGRWLFRVGTAPALRVGVAQYADLLRGETETLRGLDLCGIDAETYTQRVEKGQAYWQVMARTATPTTLRTLWSARDTALDDELTLSVLTQRGARLIGNWSQRSAVCPALEWCRATGPRSGIRIYTEGRHTVDLDASRPGLSYSITKP